MIVIEFPDLPDDDRWTTQIALNFAEKTARQNLAPLLQDLAAHEASNRIKTENLETLREQNAKLREALHSLEVSANTVGYCYDRRPENFASALSELSRQTGLARAALGESNV